MEKYIYQRENWTNFTWNNLKINDLLVQVRNLQGRLMGTIQTLGFSLQNEAMLTTLTLDVLKSSEIEGEKLNRASVRSSIARRLGLDVAGLVYSTRDIEGIVEMMLDATQNYSQELDKERLFGWHAALFPTGRSGLYKIEVGKYRTGEMQVVSGMLGNEKVHYEAVPAKDVKAEMDKFLHWINTPPPPELDNVLKAAIAHLWFVTIHPFDDGNGRIARTIADMLLARSDNSTQRFYSMSSQILTERKKYYASLKKIQHNFASDITLWLEWFLNCLLHALQATDKTLKDVFRKADFWKINAQKSLNERQILMLNKVLDGFRGNLTSSKWAKITKTSPDTALRDIKDLIAKGILEQSQSGGRSVHYHLPIYY